MDSMAGTRSEPEPDGQVAESRDRETTHSVIGAEVVHLSRP